MNVKNQPKCGDKTNDGCNHSISFHDGRVGECFAFGCKCQAWVEPKVEPEPVQAA